MTSIKKRIAVASALIGFAAGGSLLFSGTASAQRLTNCPNVSGDFVIQAGRWGQQVAVNMRNPVIVNSTTCQYTVSGIRWDVPGGPFTDAVTSITLSRTTNYPLAT